MFNIKSKNLFLFLAFMIMITTFLPLFSTYASIYVGHNLGVNRAWAILWGVSLLTLNPKVLSDKIIQYTLFIFIIFIFIFHNTIWSNVDKWNTESTSAELLRILLSISLYTYFRITRNYKDLALVIKWVLFFITVTSIMSIYTSILYPMSARLSYLLTREEALMISRLGGGGYGFASGLVCLFPMMVFYYRNNVKSPFPRSMILGFGILCISTLISLQWFAPIMLSVIFTMFSLFGSRNIKKTLITIAVFLFLVIIIPKKYYSDLFINASEFFKRSEDVRFKLNDMGNFIVEGKVGDETAAGSRLERYPLLWEAFKGNPFFGVFNSNRSYNLAGAHLYWMNKLAVYGVFGFMPLILIFYFHIKRTISNFYDKEFTFYYLLSMLSAFVMGLIKTLAGFDFWIIFLFIVPGLYYLPYLKKDGIKPI